MSNVLKVVVFVDKPPTEFQKLLTEKLRSMKINMLVDADHKEEWWFTKNFSTIPHRLFYNDPYLLSGVIDETKFNVCGIPHFVVYFSQDEEISDNDWKIIYRYFNYKLNGVDELDSEDLIMIQDLFQCPETMLLKSSNDTEIVKDEFVKITKSQDYYYKYESRHIESEDRMIICICRPDNIEEEERPFCLLIDEFMKNNYYPLFRQIYCSKDWGSIMDTNFLTNLWKELKLDGEFKVPENIDPSEGHVFRSSIDDLFKVNEFGKRFYF